MSTTTTTDAAATSDAYDGDVLAGLTKIILFLLVIGLGIASSLFSGFVLTKLWTWFVLPLGAPQIGVVQAMGLTLTLYMFTMGIPRREAEGKSFAGKQMNSILFHTIGALLVWAFGAIYHAFM